MQRNDSLDLLKFIAIICVVCIHTAPFSEYESAAVDGETIELIINITSRIAVPLFFMISGYLISQKVLANKLYFSYIKKYISKLTMIFVSWTLFYLIYDTAITFFRAERNNGNFQEMITEQYNLIEPMSLFYGISIGTPYHLWYLPALIWAAIILFIFIKMRLVPVLLIAGLGLNLIGLFGQSYSPIYEVPYQTRDPLFFGVFYVTLGYSMNHWFANRKISLTSSSIVILIVLFSVLQLAEGFILFEFSEGFWANYYFFTIPLTFFILLYAMKNPSMKVPLLNKVGANSVGIYVIHVFFISFINQFIDLVSHDIDRSAFLWNLLYTPGIFVISYLSYQVLQEVKPKRKSK